MNATATTTEATFAGRTAQEWRDAAKAARQRSAESWERSDTDGFLSQWASDTMARKYEYNAQIAEQGGERIHAFVDIATGELIKGRWMQFEHGAGYAPFDRSRKIIFPSHAKSEAVRDRNNAKKGVREVTVLAPAALDRSTGDTYTVQDGEWTILTDLTDAADLAIERAFEPDPFGLPGDVRPVTR